MDKVILFGPIIGELNWEIRYFIPFFNYIYKNNPKEKFIIYTRKERFDLYSNKPNILVPLKLEEDLLENNQIGFTINNFNLDKYFDLKNNFYNKYSKNYEIVNHYYPKINNLMHLINWQFGRDNILYEYKSLPINNDLINNIINTNKEVYLFDCSGFSSEEIFRIIYEIENKNIFYVLYKKSNNFASSISIFKNKDYIIFNEDILSNGNSLLGCFISLIEKATKVIGTLESEIVILSLLKNKETILIDEYDEDEIHLNNPLNTNYHNLNIS